MTETKERKLYSLLAKALYMFSECKCIDAQKISKFIEEVKAELPAKLPEERPKNSRPNLSQILANDPTFAAAIEEQLKEGTELERIDK